MDHQKPDLSGEIVAVIYPLSKKEKNLSYIAKNV